MKFWLTKFFSDKSAHKEAAEEVFFVCLISLIPLLALPLIEELREKSGRAFEIGNLFWSAISSGQLYLYSFALLGTLYWLCQKDHTHFDRFPPRKYFMLFILLPSILILIVYSFDPAMSKPLSTRLVAISIAVYILYVLLYYTLLVFDHLKVPDVEKDLEESAKILISEYQQQTRD
jgi:hypothetical protein